MFIHSKTKISELIKHNSECIEVIASINKNFKKLRNPILRKVLASRVSIEDASKIGGVPVCVLIDKLKTIGFKTQDDCECNRKEENKKSKKTYIMRKETIIELDVRPILDGGTDPFEAIMAQLKTMEPDYTLKIINSFEPIPLLNILKEKGYHYETERPDKSVVHTYLEKASGEIDKAPKKSVQKKSSYVDIENQFKGMMNEVDVRDMEMPMPMVTILEEIEKIDQHQALFVHHRRLPQYLLPELEKRNYKWVSKKIDEDNMKLIIYK